MSSSPSYVRLASFNDGEATGSRRKGYVPVLVGTDKEDMERLCIPIKLINHPSLVSLLDDSVQEFGDNQQGLLRVSCNADNFKELLRSLSKKK
ncbi:auxin-responsive protein SAUR71-like [Coffea eugenioides]|uniref:auxin-responsive protein SAUR71-like n=1 Tax=Coffea eugenioides TaxID=49369 RepID=UPI000F5C29BE|nr:auxin-responsive protein SAUR71-like [Coffea arabica]XP_027069089.1 auxin-responsive protein SAUR71-like [Coffea arabica]XP_027101807.1 auxin-responsive protein SAUR71-like [Coffea arabica]XP_027171544.1 auxin-responsive protein SAUR71-like [Coffea eugenioides]